MRALPAAVLGVLALAAMTAGVVSLQTTAPDPGSGVARDLDGRPVLGAPRTADTTTVDPTTPTDPGTAGQPGGSGDRLEVPAVGLDVPLGTMRVRHGVVDPPGFAAAYQVQGLTAEVPSATGTYIAMHALRGGGRAPGNALWDTEAGRPRIAIGDTVRVDGGSWRVTDIGTPTKQSVPGSDQLWSTTPDELVLLTCLETPDGRPSTRNVVVTAEPAG